MNPLKSPTSCFRSTLSSITCLVLWSAVISAEPTTSYNTGSLGTAADGVNTDSVELDQPGAVAAYQDFSSSYFTGNRTEVPYQAGLNPPSDSPFTIEFWARPTAADGDDAPVGNRLGGVGPRSGWVFFQRGETVGWNLRMYNGNGTVNGWDITGGTAILNAWSHVVAVWSGTAATLFVNGVDVTSVNNGPGGYNANTTEPFRVGALIDGASPFAGSVDEIAFYPTALTPQKIASHYATASSAEAGAYSSMVVADGALLYLQQNPPSAKLEVINLAPLATKVTFTGILSQSTDLVEWSDLTTATSPYTPASPQPDKLFFRVHR